MRVYERLLKKPSLEPTDSVYHLVLNVSFLSKVTEIAVAKQLQSFDIRSIPVQLSPQPWDNDGTGDTDTQSLQIPGLRQVSTTVATHSYNLLTLSLANVGVYGTAFKWCPHFS